LECIIGDKMSGKSRVGNLVKSYVTAGLADGAGAEGIEGADAAQTTANYDFGQQNNQGLLGSGPIESADGGITRGDIGQNIGVGNQSPTALHNPYQTGFDPGYTSSPVPQQLGQPGQGFFPQPLSQPFGAPQALGQPGQGFTPQQLGQPGSGLLSDATDFVGGRIGGHQQPALDEESEQALRYLQAESVQPQQSVSPYQNRFQPSPYLNYGRR
jgi:hypothetical protein